MNCPKKMLTNQIRFFKRSRDSYKQHFSEKQAIKMGLYKFIYYVK